MPQINESNEIQKFTSSKEGQFFDRKSAKINPKDILKHLIAFANASGGKLVIGIEDDGKITGFKIPNSNHIDDFQAAPKLLQRMPIPLISYTIEVKNNRNEADLVLVFDVQPSINRVIEADDGSAYLRVKDRSVKLKYEDRRLLEYDKGQRSFEDEIVKDSSLDELNLDLLEKYKQHLNTDSSIEEVLQARNFMNKDGEITHAGILLFGKNPTKYFPNARIKVIRYDGTSQKTGSSLNIIKEFNIEGAIPLVISKTRDAINSQLRDFQMLDGNGNFIKVTEYPEFAWFEGVVNALTHRNYAVQGDYIRVSIYDDRIEIFSPGALPNIVTLENIMNTRYSRNPRIARVLSEFGWVKELNEGVKRIFNEMEKYLLNKPTYHEPNNDSVQLTLENNIISRKLRESDQVKKLLTDELKNKLTDHELKVLHYLYNNRQVTRREVSQLLGKSDPYSRKILKSLESKGVIVWQGSNPKDPTQHYIFHTEQ